MTHICPRVPGPNRPVTQESTPFSQPFFSVCLCSPASGARRDAGHGTQGDEDKAPLGGPQDPIGETQASTGNTEPSGSGKEKPGTQREQREVPGRKFGEGSNEDGRTAPLALPHVLYCFMASAYTEGQMQWELGRPQPVPHQHCPSPAGAPHAPPCTSSCLDRR